MSSTNEAVPSINGSCHCGAITYVVKNMTFERVFKCNCTICNKAGKCDLNSRIERRHPIGPVNYILRINALVESSSLLLLNDAGEQVIFNSDTPRESAPAQLGYYSMNQANYTEESLQIWHHFCKKCGIHPFITGQTSGKTKLLVSTNLRCLDLDKVGKDIKDLTAPDKVSYMDGLTGTFQAQKGEPWNGGAW